MGIAAVNSAEIKPVKFPLKPKSGTSSSGTQPPGDTVTLSGQAGKAWQLDILAQIGTLLGNFFGLSGQTSSTEEPADNKANKNKDNEGDSKAGTQLIGQIQVPTYQSPSEIQFLMDYLKHIEKVCDLLGKMFEEPEETKISQEEYEKKTAEKKKELKELENKIDIAKQASGKTIAIFQQINVLLSAIAADPSNAQAKIAEAGELISELKVNITTLISVSQKINKHIAVLKDLGVSGQEIDQLAHVSTKLSKTIETATISYAGLRNELAVT